VTDARVVLEEVACVRGGRLLFEGLSLTLPAGGAALLTGPNGAGKSSLLRLVAGLLRPAAGRVTCRGAVGLQDERHALDPELTLARALGFWAALDGGDARAGIAAMRLDELKEVPVRLLSTGQRRRGALARVIASRAAVWLLDEPANGLDADAASALDAALAAHRRRGGIVLAASHQPLGMIDPQVVRL
jgi:heme exporter protein A